MATIIKDDILNVKLRQENAILYSRLQDLESNVDMWQKRAFEDEIKIIVLERRLKAALVLIDAAEKKSACGTSNCSAVGVSMLGEVCEEEYLRQEREVEAWTKAEAAKEEAIQEQWESQCGEEECRKEESAEEQWERHCSEEL